MYICICICVCVYLDTCTLVSRIYAGSHINGATHMHILIMRFHFGSWVLDGCARIRNRKTKLMGLFGAHGFRKPQVL